MASEMRSLNAGRRSSKVSTFRFDCVVRFDCVGCSIHLSKAVVWQSSELGSLRPGTQGDPGVGCTTQALTSRLMTEKSQVIYHL